MSNKKPELLIPANNLEVLKYYVENINPEFVVKPDLMITYGSLDNIFAHADEIKSKSLREKVVNGQEAARLSYKLATININADIETSIEAAVLGNIFTAQCYQLFAELSFKNLLSKFEGASSSSTDIDSFKENFYQVNDIKTFDKMKDYILKQDIISIFVLQDKKRAVNEEADGQLSLFDMDTAKRRCVLSFSAGDNTYFVDSELLEFQQITSLYKQLLAENCILLTHGIKKLFTSFDIQLDEVRNISKTYFDTELALYLLDPLKSSPDIDMLMRSCLDMMLPEFKIKPEKESIKEMLDNENQLSDYMCLASKAILKSYEILKERLEEANMLDLYKDIELPTAYVLYSMEREGMLVKKDELANISSELKASISKLEDKIYEQAGEKFNINSPKQLGELLFEKMGLEGGKKTKTGYSTSADVLEKLSGTCPMVRDILDYRTLTKLRSTYAEGLAQFIEEDNRIHSNFNQTITATGRISSDNPNLQNIPTRFEEGRRLRKVFVAPEGHILVDADYSQVELRILAAFSGDEQLIKAYSDHSDIHTLTASKVFHVEPEEVTDIMRRNAKAVNFGIVYGISSFGLSQDLSISREEAKGYIEEYFKTYPGINSFLENAKNSAKEKGYSVTFMGRRRPIPELKSSNYMQRQFGERVAMNAPIQGSAADVMKLAMIGVYERLKKEKLSAKLILQVHDELIVETPLNEEEMVRRILKEEMEGAADLAVNLEISCESGKSWYDAK